MKLFSFFLILLSLTTTHAQVFKALIVDSDGVVRGHRGIRDLSLCGSDLGPAILSEGPVLSTVKLKLECRQEILFNKSLPWPGSEVRTLISQGPSANRIDLTIVGDGYTEAEKQKFFEDAQHVTDDLFNQDTFATYRALFNVHAVYVPSAMSGIGDGQPQNTALGLYRHPTTRQAVISGKESEARRAAQLAPDTDYPILLGNDAFYGGLGGEFAITTSAPLNITTVLRHELGHNFGRVGEEYDGGQVYSGANFSYSQNVSWKHHIPSGRAQVYRMESLHYSAPWKSLTNSDFQQSFQVLRDSKVLFDFSSLGFDTATDVQVFIDNELVSYDGKYNYDRNFYLIEKFLTAGQHSIRFHRNTTDTNNIISKLAIYSVPQEFPFGSDTVGAFATYDYSSQMVGYRPTDRVCLMKDMASHKFCNICTENMWRNFLQEVSLIDAIKVSGMAVQAELAPVGADRLEIQWVDPRGQVRSDLANKLAWTAAESDRGNWKLKVRFVSPEVIDPNQETYTVHTKMFRL